MALTAREWLLLPEQEQKERAGELSHHECFLLRTELSHFHFSEEAKKSLSREQRDSFLHSPQYAAEELESQREKNHRIFREMIREAEGALK